MKKLFLLFFLMLLFQNYFLYSQCPQNRTNCSYGCGRYIDNDKDGFCDYTAFTEDIFRRVQACTDSIAKAKQAKVNLFTKDSLSKIINLKKKLLKSNEKKIAEVENIEKKIVSKESINIDSLSKEDTNFIYEEPEVLQNTNTKPYDLLFISITTVGLYLLTMLLATFGWIKKQTHRRFWNILLLLTFLVSCLFGFFLVIQINYNFVMDWLKTVLYWHVEIGIAMTVISVFHILWHLRYFKNILKKSK